MRTFGLIGRKLSHSFSPKYFAQKFNKEGILNTEYLAFPLTTIEEFPVLFQKQENLVGLNVTIPYKTTVIPFLDKVDCAASEIGAVNTIRLHNGELHGFNTDVYGFEQSLQPLLKPYHQKALVLGTGGAAKAVCYVLQQLNIPFKLVSRNPHASQLSYQIISPQLLEEYLLVINTTPLGMYPNINEAPSLPYLSVGNKHLFYDLVYNPQKTLFLQRAEAQGATIKNGLEMLHLQAEKAWQIWNNPNYS
ncbi:MAG: shikimate dehydrogenase [Aureispira sp.]|nr:shikimate dehydrogenase [Aureispira sp.]